MAKNLEFEGVQFDGAAIVRIAGELARQKESKRDFIYPANKLSYTDEGRLVLGATKTFDVGGVAYTSWQDAEAAADAASKEGKPSKITPLGEQGEMPLNGTAASQLYARLNVPAKFVDHLRAKEYTKTAGNLFRDLLRQDDRRFLVRTLDGKARAVLSDRYRILDNADLFFCAAEKFKEVGAQAWKARLWDDGFELFGVSGHIAGEVTTDRTFDPGDGWQSRWAGKEGDVHNAACRIRNSETGEGGLSVRLAIFRKVCANFNVWTNGVSQIHAGKTNQEEGLIFSDETRSKESELIWSKVRDAITTAFDPVKFKTYIDQLNGIAAEALAKPMEAVENVTKAYAITDDRKASILASLLGSGDLSRFGLVQAITATAHKADADGAAADASKLEEIGGEVALMSAGKFGTLVGAA